MIALKVKVNESISSIPANEWNALAGTNPFLSHEFFSSLEESGCASAKTGWLPQFLTVLQGDKVIGGMPLYLKSHSFGEFVFDWAWADAYAQNGLEYYPKLVSSVPFTPVSGFRTLAETEEVRRLLVRAALELARATGVSSLHCLFPTESEAQIMEQEGMMLRRDVQFHWKNKGYRDFEEFLSEMRHDKRKKIRQERRKCAGIQFRRVRGSEATEADWDFFFLCYTRTHIQYNSPQAFNRTFFSIIAKSLSENILFFIAEREGRPIACSFTVLDRDVLYGRNWGAIEFHPGLHFETSYYQAIDFCIEHKIRSFEGGAQGEHKLARGFLPTPTRSAHWLARPEFSSAVEDFLRREGESVANYTTELLESSPFRRKDS